MGTLGGVFFFVLFQGNVRVLWTASYFLGGWSIKSSRALEVMGLRHPSLPTCICSPNPRNTLFSLLFGYGIFMLTSQSAVGPHSTACIIFAATGHFLHLPCGWKWGRPGTFSKMRMGGKKNTENRIEEQECWYFCIDWYSCIDILYWFQYHLQWYSKVVCMEGRNSA